MSYLRTVHTSQDLVFDKDGRPESVETIHVNRHLMPMMRHTGTMVKIKPSPPRVRRRKLKRVRIA